MGLLALGAMILSGNGYAKSSEADKYASCTVPILLKGTVVAEDKPEWSQAQIDDPKTDNARTFTLKRPWVYPGAKLVEIGEGFVTLEVGKAKELQRCFTEGHVFTAPDKGSQADSAPITYPADAPKAKLKESIDLLMSFPQAGDPVPAEHCGSRYSHWNTSADAKHGVSFQLMALTEKSPLWKMGFRRWDIVTGLNGQKFDEPSKAAKIFEQMSNDTEKLIFELRRRGKVIKVEYQP